MTKYIFVTGGVVSSLGKALRQLRSADCLKAAVIKLPSKSLTLTLTLTPVP